MQPDHYQNAVSLLEQYVKMQNKKKELERQYTVLCDTSMQMDTIDEIERLEEEIKYANSYSRTLIEQATVIINENNVTNVPSLETLEARCRELPG